MSVELFQARDAAMDAADEANDDALRFGEEAAEYAREFRRLKALEALELRERKVPASIIGDAIYASDEVNAAKANAELAQVRYGVAKEAVNPQKRRADIRREDIAREWGQSR